MGSARSTELELAIELEAARRPIGYAIASDGHGDTAKRDRQRAAVAVCTPLLRARPGDEPGVALVPKCHVRERPQDIAAPALPVGRCRSRTGEARPLGLRVPRPATASLGLMFTFNPTAAYDAFGRLVHGAP